MSGHFLYILELLYRTNKSHNLKSRYPIGYLLLIYFSCLRKVISPVMGSIASTMARDSSW